MTYCIIVNIIAPFRNEAFQPVTPTGQGSDSVTCDHLAPRDVNVGEERAALAKKLGNGDAIFF